MKLQVLLDYTLAAEMLGVTGHFTSKIAPGEVGGDSHFNATPLSFQLQVTEDLF